MTTIASGADIGLPTGPTGRTIVVLDRTEPAREVLQSIGVSATPALELPQERLSTPGCGAIVLEHLGLAILDEAPAELRGAVADASTPVLAAEPEVYVYPFPLPAEPPFTDTDAGTWGLHAIGVVLGEGVGSGWDGSGITVAVLDTGADLTHPDLQGQVRASRSFVDGEQVQDAHGHGTHVCGTIAAHASPAGGGRRFSVAPGARLLVGKVLSNSGSGTSGGVLAGMNWAIEQGAHIISMSLGSAVARGTRYLSYYEAAGRAALDAGSVIIAAAGNEGWAPVGSPANCPSVVAVAAVGPDLLRAEFSCVALEENGGELNLAGPGVDVFSSWPVADGGYAVLSGTSMATPHVSGLAALTAQQSGLRGRELWERLVAGVRPLSEGAQLVGAGLAQVPAAESEPSSPSDWVGL